MNISIYWTLCTSTSVLSRNSCLSLVALFSFLRKRFGRLIQGWAIYGPRAESGPPQCFIRSTCACRNHDYSLYGYKFPFEISMKINQSSAKIDTVTFHELSAPEHNVQNKPHIPQTHPSELFMSF